MSDNEGDGFTINENFAKSYNRYRQKEELQRLKDKYGEEAVDDNSSTSESEDDDAVEITPLLEKDFFTTLAYLKRDDPAIYDKNKQFFDKDYDAEKQRKVNSTNQKPMFMKDYERKVITEKEGKFVEDEEEGSEPEHDIGYYEEQQRLKDDLKQAIMDHEGSDEGDEDGLLTKAKKNEEVQHNDLGGGYKAWLSGEKDVSADENLDEMRTLKEYWTDKSLDSGEQFLRDYFLKQKYIDPKDELSHDVDVKIPSSSHIHHEQSEEEDISEDESFAQTQETFEHKYNFRFEEPDKEFIKSYPRTVYGTVRRKDDTRKRKREIQREKEEEKKKRKKEELMELKKLKKQEILDKIEQLRRTTGNNDINFEDADIEDEFDPNQYDDRMKELFDEDYYEEGGTDDEKPIFSDYEEDEMGEYDPSWMNYGDDDELDIEDPNFNMDCDYNPAEQQRQDTLPKKRFVKNPLNADKKHRKKSAFFESVAKEKPVFDPDEKTFQDYLDEYYQLDYEDLIGDLPCRFKYRKVMSNSFGLTTEEILQAPDRELNAWCSLKKAVQYRSEEEEKRDKMKYSAMSKNINKKAKILKTVYQPSSSSTEKEDISNIDKSKLSKSQKRRLRKKQRLLGIEERNEHESTPTEDKISETNITESENDEHKETIKSEKNKSKKNPHKKTKNSSKDNQQYQEVSKIPTKRLEAYGLNAKKFLNKVKYKK